MSTQLTSSSTTPPLLPRDARLIALLLAANGAEDCEEGVVRMLVEFAHRYTTDILSDSLMYAEHAKSGDSKAQQLVPSLDDIRLAIQARTDGASVSKEFLLQLATTVNAAPLPAIPEVYGIRLPPVSSRLTAPNFSLTPRTSQPIPATPPPLATRNGSEALESEDGDNGLFGGDDDEEEEEEDDDDDEEMEDVTAGIGGSGGMEMSRSGSNGETNGNKRKAGASDDEEYD